ncbi:thioredoxin 1 [Elusimicrobium posterum]|uniref:thioredoxin n=1 Tax=Elusimicrobium posterum TaxID=3116653 RepID=UPI003C7417D9
MSEINLTDDNFEAEVLKYPGVAMVDFWAVWCGPCKMFGPTVEEIAKEYEGKAKICKLNTDEGMKTSAQFRVSSIPTVIFFKGGQPVAQMVGLQSKEAVKKQLDALL